MLSLTSDLLATVKKTEDSLMRLKKTKRKGKAGEQQGGEGTEGKSARTDEDKIRLQLLLDVQEYGRIISSLGIDANSVSSYSELLEMVAQAERVPLIFFFFFFFFPITEKKDQEKKKTLKHKNLLGSLGKRKARHPMKLFDSLVHKTNKNYFFFFFFFFFFAFSLLPAL